MAAIETPWVVQRAHSLHGCIPQYKQCSTSRGNYINSYSLTSLCFLLFSMLWVIPASDLSWNLNKNSLQGTPSFCGFTLHLDKKADNSFFSSFKPCLPNTSKNASKLTCNLCENFGYLPLYSKFFSFFQYSNKNLCKFYESFQLTSWLGSLLKKRPWLSQSVFNCHSQF